MHRREGHLNETAGRCCSSACSILTRFVAPAADPPSDSLQSSKDPAVARKILECLGLPARAPPLEPTALDDVVDGAPSDEEAACEFDQALTYQEP